MTIEEKNISILKTLIPSFADKIRNFITVNKNFGITILLLSGKRTFDEQEILYKKYKSGKGGLAAKPGYSYHNYAYAIDWVEVLSDGSFDWKYKNISKILTYSINMGLKSLHPKDSGHLQDTSVTLSNLQTESKEFQEWLKKKIK